MTGTWFANRMLVVTMTTTLSILSMGVEGDEVSKTGTRATVRHHENPLAD